MGMTVRTLPALGPQAELRWGVWALPTAAPAKQDAVIIINAV